MKRVLNLLCLVPFLLSATTFAQGDEWKSLFDGKTLTDWDGDPNHWSVEDGAITGKTSDEQKLKANSFLIYRGEQFDNFELQLEYKIVNGNSGIQYRSFELPKRKWGIGGYQADFEAGDTYSGILYGEQFRGILALRGEMTELTSGKNGKMKKTVVEKIGVSEEIQAKIRKEDWNKYKIVASGYRFQHFINGTKTVEVVDNDIKNRRATGLLALQIHVGPAMTVQFKNIRICLLYTSPSPRDRG